MHTRETQTMSRAIAFMLASALAPVVAQAQALPDPRAVMAKYVQVTNAAKLTSTPGQRMTGTLQAGPLTGTVESYRDRSGRALQVVTIAGIGQMKEGTEPDFKWTINPIEGPKLIEGKEFMEAKEREDPRAAVRDPELVVDAVAMERTTVDSQPCVKLKLSWKSGRTTTECYSETTGYLLSSESVESSSMGAIALSITYGDYKTFGGVTVPTRTVQRSSGTEFVLRVTELVFESIDPAKFALPPEIQALRKK